MTSTRPKKRKPEQIVAKQRDALVSDCQEGHGGGSAGHARLHLCWWPPRAFPTVCRLHRGEYAGATNPEQAGLASRQHLAVPDPPAHRVQQRMGAADREGVCGEGGCADYPSYLSPPGDHLPHEEQRIGWIPSSSSSPGMPSERPWRSTSMWHWMQSYRRSMRRR
jgi:hypothetical protein